MSIVLYFKTFSGGQGVDVKGDNILEYNHQTEEWQQIGTMTMKRRFHAVTVVNYDEYESWCQSKFSKTKYLSRWN